MEIVHFASELAPIAKIGGLGDALFGLARAQIEAGHTVEVILPKYDTLHLKEFEKLGEAISLTFTFEKKRATFSYQRGVVLGIPVTLISSDTYFGRGTIYGCPDDPLRFSFFSKAALEYLVAAKKSPDILHLHDWHTSIVAPLFRTFYTEKMPNAKLILTIHNLAYQGVTPADLLDALDLSSAIYHQIDQLQDGYVKGNINLLKGGIVNADFVTTVSPTYASEILKEAHHNHLSEILHKNRFKFKGVLNGIDYAYWNPTEDPLLPTHFSIKDLKSSAPFLAGKERLKTVLRQTIGLEQEVGPIVCAITRLVQQKGPELIKQGLYRTLERGGQFVLIGSAQESDTLLLFSNLKKAFANSPRVVIELGYNEPLAHLVYAASDLFLVPSLFEPCGLTQMIAMRYGTLPLVRGTGGLADTVTDEVNGFVFGPPTIEALQTKLDMALDVWYNHPALWAKMVHSAMSCNYSWEKPAEEYVEIYKQLSTTTATR